MQILPNPQKIFWLILGLASFLAGQSAQALQLGAIVSRSDTQQALHISMQVRLAADEQLSQLRCQIASPDQFSSFNLSKPSFADAIQCSLQAGKTPQNALLTLQSPQLMPQATLPLVLVISQAEQAPQLVPFTIILDAPAATQLPSVASVPLADPQSQADAPVGEQTDTAQKYQVSADETLMNVARQLGIAEADMNQFMLAVLQRNPQAFIQGNMHLLKQGSVLQIPNPADWQAIDAETARQQLQSQAALSREYRQLSSAQEKNAQDKSGQDVAADYASEAKQDSTGHTPNAANTAPADSRDANARDIVKLSNAAGANSRVQGLTVQEEINALRDELAAHEVSIREANQKTAELEKQIQQMKNLLFMREKALAQIELQRPWWDKLNTWLGQNAWAVLLLILALLLGLVLGGQAFSQRRAEKRLQALAQQMREMSATGQSYQPTSQSEQAASTASASNAELPASSPASRVSQGDMPSLQTALDVQAVLEKTAQILQGIDLSLSDQAQAQTSVRAQANAGAAKASTTKVSTTIDTQFDLVASYMDMGELAKAEQLLQQIIQQGDAKQQARAKRLLKKISSE